MPDFEIHPITDHHYELVDSLPGGRVCWIEETPGTAVAQFVRGHATDAFVEFMTEAHRPIIEQELWRQFWTPGAARLEVPAEGLGFARARWALLPPEDEHRLEPGGIAAPFERDGAFIWLIRPPHVSPQVVDEFNLLLARLVEDGLWRQNSGAGR